MSTQACTCSVYGTKGQTFLATATDDVYGSLVDSNSLEIGDSLRGETITGLIGSYTSGAAVVRLRNTVTNKVSWIRALNIITEEEAVPVPPTVIKQDDVLEVLPVATPT